MLCEVPALSSAEAEIIAIVETAKEMVSLGMLLQTMTQGIPIHLACLCRPRVKNGVTMFNDAKAALDAWTAYYEESVAWNYRKLSLTHWRGENNPADGLTKSLKPL